VLASLGGGGDADDLARAALKDQEIANADVVAGDGDGVGSHGARTGGGLDGADGRDGRGSSRGGVGVVGDGGVSADGGGHRGRSSRSGGVPFLDNYLFTAIVVLGADERLVVGVVVVGGVVRVNYFLSDLVSSFGDTVTERMVVAVFVVISHITLAGLRGVLGVD
jgi:hypothetical protein